jgi:hypothetical protein
MSLEKQPSDAAVGCGGCLGIILVIFVIGWVISSCGGSTSSDTSSTDTSQDSSSGNPATPNPHATTYEQYLHQQKEEFLSQVDESISGTMIAGNKLKYVGDNVDLHCTVESIIDANSFNAECGEDGDGDPAIILVEYNDTSSLDKGQAVRILGTVADPVQGINGFGGQATFPTVEAEFME